MKINLVNLEGVDGEDNGVLHDGAEDHEDAGHDVGVDGVELGQSRRWSILTNTVEDVDQDQQQDDQE